MNIDADVGDFRLLDRQVVEAFRTYEWPGNVRELENVIERAYILERSDMLMPLNFPANMMPAEGVVLTDTPLDALSLARGRQLAIEDFERRYLRELLSRNKGRINLSARQAGITSRQLNRLMNHYKICKEDYKS